jgi:hypothetical protein
MNTRIGGQEIEKHFDPARCGKPMLREYQAVYKNAEGPTIVFDLVKDPISRAYRLSCADGLRPISKFLDGGLEFLDFKLAHPKRLNGDRSNAERFMRMLLRPPIWPRHSARG